MAKVLAKMPASPQHPLALELRSILDNPNASLGQLAGIVQRINAELKLFEEQSKRLLKAEAMKPATPRSTDAEIESLRSLIAGMQAQTRR